MTAMGPTGNTLLAQRIGRCREGVAAAEAGAAQILVDHKRRAAVIDLLAVELNRAPGGADGKVFLAAPAETAAFSPPSSLREGIFWR